MLRKSRVDIQHKIENNSVKADATLTNKMIINCFIKIR